MISAIRFGTHTPTHSYGNKKEANDVSAQAETAMADTFSTTTSELGTKPVSGANFQQANPDVNVDTTAIAATQDNSLDHAKALKKILREGDKALFINKYQQLSSAERVEKILIPKLVKAAYGRHAGKEFYTISSSPSVLKEEFEKLSKQQQSAKWGSPILVEALRNNPEIFKWLLTQPESQKLVKQKDAFGTTALSAAIQTGQSQAVIETLLSLGANPLSSDIAGYTPLKWATYGGRPEIVEALLKHEAVAAKLNPEDVAIFRKEAQNKKSGLEGAFPLAQYASQNAKNHQLVMASVTVARDHADPRSVIPYIVAGADVNGDDFTSEPGYKGHHGSPIDFAQRSGVSSKFELILTAAGLNVGPSKDKDYYNSLRSASKHKN